MKFKQVVIRFQFAWDNGLVVWGVGHRKVEVNQTGKEGWGGSGFFEWVYVEKGFPAEQIWNNSFLFAKRCLYRKDSISWFCFCCLSNVFADKDVFRLWIHKSVKWISASSADVIKSWESIWNERNWSLECILIISPCLLYKYNYFLPR